MHSTHLQNSILNKKKYKKALKNITKAYHLSGKEVHKKKIKIYKNKLLKN